MATAKIRPSSRRKSVTLPRKRRLGQAMRVFRVLTLLAIPNLVLTCGGTTTTSSTTSRTTITPILEEDEETNCRVDFLLFPSSAPSSSSSSTRLLSSSTSSSQPVHHHLDILQVTYRSSLTSPTLSLWCGDPDHHPRKASLKFRTSHVIPRTGNLEIPLNFSSDLPCWFELTQDDIYHCGDVNTSDTFLVLPTNHQGSATPPNRPATALAVRQEVGATTSATSSVVPTATADVHRGGGEHNLSPGAKVAVGISATVVFLSIVAMSALLFLRRRRKGHDTELAGAIIEHDRRSGKKGQEKKRNAAPSIASGGSEEPLYPPIIQPVFDGFPGSTGYDDVRSLHSSLINSHSPVHGPDSPTSLSNGPGFWGTQGRSIEREELAAARLKAKAHTTLPTVVSYGPNPVTPTLTPRTSSRVDLNKSVASHSPDSIEAIPHVPHIPVSVPDYIPDYSSYSIPPPTSTPSPPRKPAAPIVVSYGPNRVTPTPLVVSPTVPPDDSVINRRFQETVAGGGDINSNNNNNISNHNNSPYHHERQFSWEADSPLLGTTNMGPLPPYASTADFEAMEKGAVRKLAEPQAEAELPPTKDGFYHGYGAPDIVEYELPGAAPQNEPQLPHQNYKPHHYLAGSSSVAGGNVGGYREIEEQKFLLNDLMSDADIRRLKEEKAKQKAERERGMREARERGEEYDLGETMGEARAREREANGFGMGMGMGGGMNIR